MRESILRARDGENSLTRYGILLSVIEAKLEDLVFIFFSRGQVVNRNGVDISGCGIL